MALSKKQAAIIHVAKKQLRLNDETYRHILQKVSNVSSASELDSQSFKPS